LYERKKFSLSLEVIPQERTPYLQSTKAQDHKTVPFSLNTGKAGHISPMSLHPSVPLVQWSLLNLAEPICVLCVGYSLLKALLYMLSNYIFLAVLHSTQASRWYRQYLIKTGMSTLQQPSKGSKAEILISEILTSKGNKSFYLYKHWNRII